MIFGGTLRSICSAWSGESSWGSTTPLILPLKMFAPAVGENLSINEGAAVWLSEHAALRALLRALRRISILGVTLAHFFFFFFKIPVLASALLNSLATLCATPPFFAKAGSGAAPAIILACGLLLLGIAHSIDFRGPSPG